jgi:glutaconyl-CoA/methylmalonyl-CoA decarboxylase subunit gamma
MKRNFRITVDGRSYNVVVEDLDVDVSAAPVASIALAATVAAPVAAQPAPVAVSGIGSIAAPLGGVVVSIEVALGRDVAVGDRVATIEAMKMKTDVLAKIAGKVTAVTAKINESVETGQVLMTVG